jgi:hypothetical protein
MSTKRLEKFVPKGGTRGSSANRAIPRASIINRGKTINLLFTEQHVDQFEEKGITHFEFCPVITNGLISIELSKCADEGRGAILRTEENYPQQAPHTHCRNVWNIKVSRDVQQPVECEAEWRGDTLVYRLPDSFYIDGIWTSRRRRAGEVRHHRGS